MDRQHHAKPGARITSTKSGIKTLQDATQRVVTVSATSVTQETGVYPSVLNDMFGTKFKVVAGYSTGGMLLAVEQGEVDGLCGYSWQTFKANGSNWFSDNKVNILVQMGLEKIPEFPDVPKADDLLPNPEDKQVLDMVVSSDEYGRPYLAPPGTPADRMAIYRQAFEVMLKDPQFLAEAAQQRIVIDPLDDKEIKALLHDRAYEAPKASTTRAAIYARRNELIMVGGSARGAPYSGRGLGGRHLASRIIAARIENDRPISRCRGRRYRRRRDSGWHK